MAEDVKTVIDELIAERAPWYFEAGVHQSIMRICLNGLLDYKNTVELANSLANLPARKILQILDGNFQGMFV